ncbi:MAG TPA: anthranilate synthase component I [Candidatus Koribacter sp.]|jgi:anthranilate synthase component 1
MDSPDFKAFSQIAKDATLVTVSRTISADLLTPVSAFLALAEKEPYSFLLESVEGGERIGRYTFLGIRPYMVVSGRGDEVTIRRGKQSETRKAPLLETVRKALREHKPANIPGLPPFTAGAVGYFAYDAVRNFEKLPATTKDDLKLPDGVFMFFDRLLAFDHLRHQLHLIAAVDVRNERPRKAYDRAFADLDALEKKLASGLRLRKLSREKSKAKIRLHARTKPSDYMGAVKRSKEYIAAGDIFQVVLSQRLDFPLPAAPFDIYRSLRTVNPSPYMYFLRMDDLHVLGSSPEMLVKVSNRTLEYRPIAGTYKRGKTPEEDAQLEEHLRTNEKERAEHVMLVDLGRNDLGRVSEYGTVKVKGLMYVERYSHVMHLVSALEGKLRSGLDALDAFAACFPAGTLSGAPKVRAMEIIEELEPTRRGVYGGSVLYADFAGNLDSCIAIRTMVVKNKRAYVQAGAGIVADSDPESEFQECRNKAQAVVRAAELAGS